MPSAGTDSVPTNTQQPCPIASRSDKDAALKLMRRLITKQCFAPVEVVIDKLGSYAASCRELRLTAHYEKRPRVNKRAENDHHSLRRREYKLQRFKSVTSAQRFLSC